MSVTLFPGDCLEVMRGLPENSIDAVVTDPPYHLTSIVKRFGGASSAPAQYGTDGVFARSSRGFMGKEWDGGDIAFRPETWAEVLRVMKPGAHLAAFGAPKNYHRLACAIEDAGFEIRDCVHWVFGSGFPKSLDVSRAIDKAAGAEREITAPATDAARKWSGWGTALKPAYEPVVLARKPLSEKTVAANVLRWGTGAINIDATRVETSDNLNGGAYAQTGIERGDGWGMQRSGAGEYKQPTGRWPANLCHDGSDEVIAVFPNETHRFFYSSKASKADRAGSNHPTVKPVALMRWLVRMITPPGGTVLDPFAGSGTTGQAVVDEGFAAYLIEKEQEYQEDIKRRLADHVRALEAYQKEHNLV